MNSRLIAIAVMILSCGVGESLADNGAVVLAQPTDQITIDGDFSDWPSTLPWRSIERVDAGDPIQDAADFAASFRVAYDDSALYVAVAVNDDSTVTHRSRDLAVQDGCSVYLDYGHRGDELDTIQYTADGSGASLLDSDTRKLASWSSKQTGTQRTYEGRIEFSATGESSFNLEPNCVAGIEIRLSDRDQDGSHTEVGWGAGPLNAGGSIQLGDVLFVSSDEAFGTIRGRLILEGNRQFHHRAVKLHRIGQTTPLTLAGDSRGEIEMLLPVGEYHATTLSHVPLGIIQVEADSQTSFRFDMQPANRQISKAGPAAKVSAGKTAINGNLYRYLSMGGSDLALAQAADGSIWLAADWCGLAHFDGRSLTFIQEQDRPRVPCLTVAEDSNGNVWGGNLEGLFRYDGNLITRFAGQPGLAAGPVRQIVPGPAGAIWIRTDRAVSRYDGESFSTLYTSDSDAKLTSLAVESPARIWIGAADGLVRLDAAKPGPWHATRYTPADGLPGSDSVHVRRLLIDPFGRLWIGTTEGLCQFDGESFQTWTKKHGLIDNDILALAGTDDGRLWVATKDGLDWFANGRFTEAVRDMRILDLFVDREQNIWIVRGGLSRLDSNRPEVLSDKSGHFIRARYALLQSRDGALWTATPQGLVRYQDGETRIFTAEDGLVDRRVRCLLEDSRGHIWIGTESGVSRFDGERFVSLTAQDGLSANLVQALAEDRHGQIWVGASSGITIYNPRRRRQQAGLDPDSESEISGEERLAGQLTHLTTAHGLSSDNVVSLLSAADGSMWIGTDNGICRWREDLVEQFEPKLWVNRFLQDRDLELWAAESNGLYHFEGSRWNHVADCGDATVMGIAEDPHGQLWMATKGGLKVYDGFAAQTLTTTDGVPDFWCRDVICNRREGGVLFISGMKVARYRRSLSPPPVKIVSVSSDRRHDSVSDFRITTAQSFLQFAFHGTSFKTRGEEMLYRYRLRGLSNQWTLTRGSRASYGSLPKGKYTFEVEAIDRDLSYSDAAAKVSFVVDRDYRHSALWGSLGLSILAVVFLSVTVAKRERGIRRLNVELDQRVKDRTAKLESETAENRKLHEQLLQAQKLDAVGTMASGIAHDFNNSLAVITGFAEVAKRNSSGPDELIDHILTAAKQATGTTKNLLTFSKESHGEKTPHELVQLVRETTSFLCKMLPTSIELSADLPERGALWCLVDSVQIQQVLVNVAMNARDAMPDGGQISVSVCKHPSQPGHALLSVSDNGMGMSAEVRKRIFDPFFTTKSRGRGTGLGMSIVHGIIVDHQGWIEIESSRGLGTTVAISLPCCAPQTPEPERYEPLIRGRGETILVVEDHRDVQSMIVAQLESAGFDVLTADDGQQALEVLQENQSQIRLALLDIDLPVMDGKACLREIAARHPDLPAILMSGLSSIDPSQLATPFLRKPFDHRTLLTTIADALQPQSAVRRAAADSAPVGDGVLAIDDDTLVQLSTQALLSSHGLDVFLADGRKQALRLLRDNLDRIGAVLMDWNLPQTDSQSLLRELRDISPAIRVLVVSGDQSLVGPQLEMQGFSGLLRKPVSSEELIAAVRPDRTDRIRISARSAV